MRVLYFSTDFGPHDQRFLAALSGTRHEVHFLRLRQGAGTGRDSDLPARIHPVEWTGMTAPFRWWAVPRLVVDLRRVLKVLRPDLIHAGPIQTCAFVAVLTGYRPVLTMSWGFDLMQDAERSPVWRWVTKHTLRRSTFFVSDANVTRERAVAYGMPPERTAVFPWGVDLRRFRPVGTALQRPRRSAAPQIRKRRLPRPAAGRSLVILCNRSWEARYGVDVLARAFVIAASRLRDLSLILLGDGSQARSIRAILLRGGQLDRVRFGGRIPPGEMHQWYRRADLYISPSHVDGSSVSLMEALASGTPAVVSDIPANREWIGDGVNGWLFRDGDAQHLAERILWIAAHKPALARISRAARRTAEERADWGRNFKVLLWAYEQAVSGERQ